MSEQPKLTDRHEPWEHVAREFGDHDMETEGGWNPVTTMEPVCDPYYIGDWLPAEAICKEVVALRAELDRAESEMLHRKLDETEAALRRVTAWVKHMDSHVDTDWCYMTKLEEILSNNGLWRDPEPKEESDA